MPCRPAHRVSIGPADVSPSPLFVAPFDRWLSQRVRLVVDAIDAACRSGAVRFVDFFASRNDDVFSREPRRYYAADLVHPADDAYAYRYDVLRRACPLQRWLGGGTPRHFAGAALRYPAPLPQPARTHP